MVNHVYHTANKAKATHGLARFALRLDNECIWLEDNHPPLLSIVILE